jgi:hypothetical protein
MTFGSPKIVLGSPKIVFGSPKRSFGSPKMVFGSPEMVLEGPDSGIFYSNARSQNQIRNFLSNNFVK